MASALSYILFGSLLTLLLIAFIMPIRYSREQPGYGPLPPRRRWGPYWAHGGGAYTPGVLY
jgi:hypothetical protein